MAPSRRAWCVANDAAPAGVEAVMVGRRIGAIV